MFTKINARVTCHHQPHHEHHLEGAVFHSLHSRTERVLDLQPACGAAGSIRTVDPLGYDTFAAELAGVLEDHFAVVSNMVGVVDAIFGARQDLAQPRLPIEQFERAYVLAIEL